MNRETNATVHDKPKANVVDLEGGIVWQVSLPKLLRYSSVQNLRSANRNKGKLQNRVFFSHFTIKYNDPLYTTYNLTYYYIADLLLSFTISRMHLCQNYYFTYYYY